MAGDSKRKRKSPARRDIAAAAVAPPAAPAPAAVPTVAAAMPKRPKIATLGDLARDGRLLWLNCERCNRTAPMEPEDLARQHGAALPLPAFLKLIRCAICGAKHPEIDFAPPPRRPRWT